MYVCEAKEVEEELNKKAKVIKRSLIMRMILCKKITCLYVPTYKNMRHVMYRAST